MFEIFDDSLITSSEVVKFAPSHEGTEQKFSCNFIITKEEKLFNQCFGWQFYCDLMFDKASYDVCEDFNENASYPKDKLIIFYDVVYIALKATSGQKPNDEEYWKLAPKFKSDCNNYLWERYLKFLLAWNVLHTSILYRAIRSVNIGLVRSYDEGRSKAATVGEIREFKHEARGDIRDIVRNMDEHIFRYPEKYPSYAPLLEKEGKCGDESSNCSRKKGHYGFNTNGSDYA